MTLPSSGAISFDQIRIELQIPTKTSFNIDDAENGNTSAGYPLINTCTGTYPSSANPASINEWYGYNHTATASFFTNGDFSATSCDDACTSTPALSCLSYAYNYSTTYFFTPECTLTRGAGYLAACQGGSGTKLGQNCYEFNSSGGLVSTVQCTTTTTTTTTTTLACYSFSIEYVSSLSDCLQGSHPYTVYSGCSSLTTSCIIYASSNCTGPLSSGTYIQTSDGTNWELGSGGAIVNSNNPGC
jgi:hypothetical protein